MNTCLDEPSPKRSRVLISYWFGERTIPLGEAMADGFRELGFDVVCFNTWIESPVYRWLLKPLGRLARGVGFSNADFSNTTRWGRMHYRQRKFEEMALREKPDILLAIHGHPIEADILQRLKVLNTKLLTIGWWVENPRDDPSTLLAQAPLYDCYFCIHRYKYGTDTRIEHLQAVGVDAKRYRLLNPPLLRDIDLVFVGSWYPKREKFLAAIADLPLTIYGPLWEKMCSNRELVARVKARSVWGDELLRLYNRSRIVLNVSIWDTGRETLNLRTLDVPATGALLLTDDSTALREFLTPGAEVATFSTPDELRTQVLRYLEDEAARAELARAGYEKVQRLGSYADKARAMLERAGWKCHDSE
jgi:spore maturation protein CgeB